MSDEHKSEEFRQRALANDWKAQVEPKFELFDTTNDVSDIEWHLYAKRGGESLHVIWHGDRLESGLYTFGDYRRKLWWRTEVIEFIEQPAREGQIPWNDETPAIDIMRALINRKITWVRKLDGAISEALVDVNLLEKGSARNFRVYTAGSGRRMLEWADSYGFHAVGLDQIINVQ